NARSHSVGSRTWMPARLRNQAAGSSSGVTSGARPRASWWRGREGRRSVAGPLVAATRSPIRTPRRPRSVQALRAALTGIDPGRIRAAVVGVAGGSELRQPEVGQAFGRAWSDIGLSCPPTYVTDLEVAFAAGTAEPSGTVLIAGTGAVAGELRDRRLVRTEDGHGWLLGDGGSGFWLGREAARATLRTLDAGEPPGPLAASVLRELGAANAPDASPLRTGLNEQRVQVIHALNTRPPVRLAELAPLVTAAFAAPRPRGRAHRRGGGTSACPDCRQGSPARGADTDRACWKPGASRLAGRCEATGTGRCPALRPSVVGTQWSRGCGLARVGRSRRQRCNRRGPDPPHFQLPLHHSE
ncbi:MAG: hypothetical protein WKF73_22225, partial [Nocardioidaceae bacterium]